MTNLMEMSASLKKGAFNLIVADLKRIPKAKGLKIVAGVFGGIFLFYFVVMAIVHFSTGGGVSTEGIEMAILMPLGMLMPIMLVIMISMVTSDDYAFNTIRNKIIAGNSRTKIFFSFFVVNLIMFFGTFLPLTIVLVPAAGIVFGFTGMGNILARLGLSIPVFVSVVAFATFVSTALKSRAGGVVINLVIQQALPAILMLIAFVVILMFPDFNANFWINALLTNPFSLITAVLSPSSDITIMLIQMFHMAGGGGNVEPNIYVLVPIVSTVFIGASLGFGFLKFNFTDFK